MRCVICVRFGSTGLRTNVHHIATGSGERSDFSVAPLCGDETDGGHHQGPAGLHGMGVKAFCRLYRPPGDCEYGLIIWTIEDMYRYGILGSLRTTR
jgi:hypothetical protein